MANDLRSTDGTDDKFVAFALTGDPALRDELVTDHLGLAHHLARRFANRGESYDDLSRWRRWPSSSRWTGSTPTEGWHLSTFAARTIIGELKRHFHDKGWAVRAPRRIQELYLELGHNISALSQQLGRSTHRLRIGPGDRGQRGGGAGGTGGRAWLPHVSIDVPDRRRRRWLGRLGADDASFAGVDDRSVLAPALRSCPSGSRRSCGSVSSWVDPVGDRPADRGESDARLPAADGQPGPPAPGLQRRALTPAAVVPAAARVRTASQLSFVGDVGRVPIGSPSTRPTPDPPHRRVPSAPRGGPMPDEVTQPDEATHEAEVEESTQAHTADRPATTEEEEAAERSRTDPSLSGDPEVVAEHYRSMAERGSRQEGEGRIV